MKPKDIPSAKPYFPSEDIPIIQDAVTKILTSGMLTLGTYTRRFETEFAEFCKVREAVAVSSGTSALEIALRSIDLAKGEEVLVPTNTFTATAAAIIFAGGTPVLTDIDAESLCIDVKNVQKNLASRTKAVIAVHVGGLICPQIKAIKEVCADHGLFLIEDAAHAHGSTIDGQSAGSLGDAGCFSFYPTKVMTTGEGGAITTNNDEMADRANILRDQGKESFSSNVIVELGYNWRMNELSAAVGLTQLKHLPRFIKRRNEIAKVYDEKLSSTSALTPLKVPAHIAHNYYKYIAFLSPEASRERFKQKLREKGVRCSGEVYWPPLHRQTPYKDLLNLQEGKFPVAEEMCRRMICLPIYSQMTLDEARYVTEMVHEVLSEM